MASTTKTWQNNNPPSVEDEDYNGFKSENNNLIEGSGQVLNTDDNQQTHKAVATYAAGGSYMIDSGTANAYILISVGARILPNSYTDGLAFDFKPTNENSSASTVAVGSLGVKNVFFNGAPLKGKEFIVEETARVRFDSANNRFNLEFSRGLFPVFDEVATEGLHGLGIFNGTTTNANDSIEIKKSDGTDLSSTNYGFILVRSLTSQLLIPHKIVANIKIDLTGAHWGIGTTGDLTDVILRVYALKDSTSLKIGIAYQGGRSLITSALAFATPGAINLPEEVLVNAGLASDAYATAIGWVRANFDDTGGAAEDLWAVQSGDGDLNLGSADGECQLWNPVFGGFSSSPTSDGFSWSSQGKTIFIYIRQGSSGVSNANTFTITLPVKNGNNAVAFPATGIIDNGGSSLAALGGGLTSANSVTVAIHKDGSFTSNWTATNTKRFFAQFSYES